MLLYSMSLKNLLLILILFFMTPAVALEVILYPYDRLDYENINVYTYHSPESDDVSYEYEDDEDSSIEYTDEQINDYIYQIPYIFRLYDN